VANCPERLDVQVCTAGDPAVDEAVRPSGFANRTVGGPAPAAAPGGGPGGTRDLAGLLDQPIAIQVGAHVEHGAGFDPVEVAGKGSGERRRVGQHPHGQPSSLDTAGTGHGYLPQW
jgi:hypothetical protein